MFGVTITKPPFAQSSYAPHKKLAPTLNVMISETVEILHDNTCSR